MRKGNDVLRQITSGTELDTEALPGRPIIEIYSNYRVLIELHNGIVEYGREKISVRVRYGHVCICGRCLEVIKMTSYQLVIGGEIHSVHLVRR